MVEWTSMGNNEFPVIRTLSELIGWLLPKILYKMILACQ